MTLSSLLSHFDLLYGNAASGKKDGTSSSSTSTSSSLVQSVLQSMQTTDFWIFVAAYYVYYLLVVGLVTIIAMYVFQVDYYSNIQGSQLRREIRLTLEGYTTNAICYWIILQCVPSWQTTTSSHDNNNTMMDIVWSYLINNIIFSAWFYLNHKLWHSNRFLYQWIHSHHHESVVVCPLTALSNRWTESVVTSLGFAWGPLLGANNVVGWYLSILTIVAEAIVGHSRIPFTLEHAAHHVVRTTNFGFYADWTGRCKWDQWLGTWSYHSDLPRMKKVYPKETQSYTWTKTVRSIHWDKISSTSSQIQHQE